LFTLIIRKNKIFPKRRPKRPENPDLLLFELVGTKYLQALLRLLKSEPPMVASQILKYFLKWDVLL
jgi:hypothetical protein